MAARPAASRDLVAEPTVIAHTCRRRQHQGVVRDVYHIQRWHSTGRPNQRLRQAFIEGAEEESRGRLGRRLTVEELDLVLRRYPGDIGADMTRRLRF
jgi:hypothetical protein